MVATDMIFYDDVEDVSKPIEQFAVWNRLLTDVEIKALESNNYVSCGGAGLGDKNGWTVSTPWQPENLWEDVVVNPKSFDYQYDGVQGIKKLIGDLENTKKMNLKVKRIDDKAIPPFRATEDSAGLDFMTIEKISFVGTGVVMVGTGCAIEIPKGYVGILTIRSSWAKRGLSLANGIGIIDADYRGEIMGLVRGTNTDFVVERGDRIFQLIVMPILVMGVEVVDELSETKRGDGGFGSTEK